MRNYALLDSTLQDELGNPTGILTSDMSIEAANRLWLAQSFFKKFEDSKSDNADNLCLELFRTNNERCKGFSLEPRSSFEDTVIGEVKSQFNDMLFSGPDLTFDLRELFAGLNVGPGASLDVASYNFYTKLFDSTLTSTSDHLFRLYRQALRDYPRWLFGENHRFTHHGSRIVAGNRLSFVPKTTEISRSICTEPNLNMLFQKGIGFFLENLLRKRFRINLSTQPVLNRRLALLGSMDGTFGTIDLSSASDSMSLSLLKEILPPYFYRWLCLSRSPYVTYPSNIREELHMVSSMGNAFTFPLQTMLFSTIVVSCYRVLGIIPKLGRSGPQNWAVFGDDIIVRKDAYSFVIRCLELFGFVVNDAKSFNTGDFRESCGGDFYKGHDIRGLYIKSLRTRADVYSAINRLVRWSSRTGILLPKTFSLLKRGIGGKILYIPPSDGDAEGLKVPYPPDSLKTDFNTFSVIYYALVKKTQSFGAPDSGDREFYYPRLKGKRIQILFNPDGLVVSLVAGFIRNGRINVRISGIEKFKVHCRRTSSWGGESFSKDVTRILFNLNALDKGQTLGSDAVTFLSSNVADSKSRGDDWIVISDLYENIV